MRPMLTPFVPMRNSLAPQPLKTDLYPAKSVIALKKENSEQTYNNPKLYQKPVHTRNASEKYITDTKFP